MNLEIFTKDMKLTEALQAHAEKKLGRLDRYLPNIGQIRLDLSHEHSARQGSERPVAQLTVRSGRGTILRAEVKDQADMYAAIDVVIDKMYRQIERYKGKRRVRAGADSDVEDVALMEAEPLPITSDGEDEEQGTIVKRKHLELTPMNEQEAIDQMELLGHAFFLFYNADTAAVNVVYKRDNGGYGLLEPSVG